MSRYTFQNKKFGLDELNKSSRESLVKGYSVICVFLKNSHVFETSKHVFE